MNTEQTREQMRATARAAAEKRAESARTTLFAFLASVSAQLHDLTPSLRDKGFTVGGVTAVYDSAPGGYWHGPSIPDRVVVTYDERHRGWRTRRKTLTYTKLDAAKLATRIRGIVAELARAAAVAKEVEAVKEAQRKLAAERFAPVRALVAAFTTDLGDHPTRVYDVTVEEHHSRRFKTTLLLTPEELERVLQTLKGGAR